MADLNDPTLNVNIANDDNSKLVSVITDGAYERLAVDANATIVNNESPTRYQLKSDIDTTGTSVTTSDTTLYTYSGSGVIDLVAINNATSSNWGIVINIDGTERLRISMTDLGSTLGLTNSAYDVVAETANKQFRWRPSEIGFTTSFTIEAYSTSGTQTLYHLILFRERTT